MILADAVDLAGRLRKFQAAGGPVTELLGSDARDFNWVREEWYPTMVGSFKIDQPGLTPFYVSLVARPDGVSKMFINIKRKGSGIIEPNERAADGFKWRYGARKRTGDNNKRNEAFRALAGGLVVTIPMPEDDVGAFAEGIVRTMRMRWQADAAGGVDQEEEAAVSSADAPDEPIDQLRRWYPDHLKTVASALLRTIRLAHSVNPNGWCITRRTDQDLIRLNVGMIRVFDARPGAVLLAAMTRTMSPADKASLGDTYDSSGGQALDTERFGDNGALRVKPDELPSLSPAQLSAHEAIVREAAKTKTSPFARFHSPAVLDALREVTGEDVPDPVLPNQPSAAWKVAPGEQGNEWDTCRNGGFIAIGWAEAGDLSVITTAEHFQSLVVPLKTKHAWGPGVDQLWKFRNIQPGDRIVANAGTRRLLGLGTVTGPYFFAPGESLPHRLPVQWDDVTPREIEKLGWRKTLIRLSAADLEELEKAPPVGSAPVAPSPEVSAPTGGIDFDAVIAHLEDCSLAFSTELVASYLLALQARRFVLLTGISGTGKTQLALEVARRFSTTQPGARDFELVAVRPDWTDPRALLGFYNPLTETYARTPTLDLILRASAEAKAAAAYGRPPHPFFLIFDEMNLARVEHYFADFLSAMESGEAIHLHDSSKLADDVVPARIVLPANLFVVGTVNVDETTYQFSPKVLDRAFVLEFNDINLDALAGSPALEESQASPLALTRMTQGLRLLPRTGRDEWTHFETLGGGLPRAILGRIHSTLTEQNRHFGYRVASEVARFVKLAAEQTDGTDDAVMAAFDVAVMSKVLPKLHGTQDDLDATLASLLRATSGEDDLDAFKVVEGGLRGKGGVLSRLPRASLKLWRMRRRLKTHGFTSFIE